MEIIYNKDSFENAVEVSNYPWGYKLKTDRRYWIETTSRGDRLCYQTLNPKTGKWCKVKKSTYSGVKVLYFDENNHVKTYSINLGYSDSKEVHKFIKAVDVEKLSNEQNKKLCEAKTINYVNSKIEVSFTNVTMMSEEEKNAHKEESEADKAKINAYANHIYSQCLTKNNLN